MIRNHPQEFDLPKEGITAFESRHAEAFEMERQQHSFHEVFLLLRGQVTITADRESRTMNAGDYAVIPAEVPHHLHDERASTVVVVAFAQSAIDNSPGRKPVWNEIRRRIGSEYRVFSSGSTAHAGEGWRRLVAMANLTVSRIELEIAFSRFLLELQAVSLRPRTLEAVERVRNLKREIGDRAHEPWSLDRAAAATNLSRRRFSELWRQCTGNSFVTSLQGVRVARAQSLMSEQALSVAAAAYAVGFNDLANFYRVFRRITGHAPGAWLAMGETKKVYG